MCVRMCVRTCVFVSASVRVCVGVCVQACVYVFMNGLIENSTSRVCSAEVFILSTSTGYIVCLLCNSFNDYQMTRFFIKIGRLWF